ncbi:restriction endonuclease subunit S [Micromonospora sp. NPDC002717]|uniref:restriction endonuclease subunit S n=1 Tax=Micromonospora sp. NPDC002717 TaxID=3154424 RepID=UPI00332DCF6E
MTYAMLPLKRFVSSRRPITYGIVQAGPDYPGGVPYIRPVDMSDSGGIVEPSRLLRTDPAIALAYRRSTVEERDLVVSIGPSFGKVMMVPPELAGANLTQGTARVAAAEGVEPRFLYWALQSQPARQHWEAAVGGATFKALNLEPLSRSPIPLVPNEDQRRIADFLDVEIQLLDRAAASKGSLQDLLRERLDAVRNLGLDELCARHGEVTLRRVIRGIEQGVSPLCDSTPAALGEWGVLKLSSVKRGKFYPHENKRLTGGDAFARYEVREGDLLVTRANTPGLVGDVAVACGDVVKKLLPDLIYRLRLSDMVRADFAAEVLLGRRVRGLIEATARGSSQSMVKLRGEDIRTWPIPNVSSTVQIEFVRRMQVEANQVQAFVEVVERQQQLILERRQALVTAAVTGQIDVTTARGVDI